MHLKEEDKRKDVHTHDLGVPESSKRLGVTIATGPGNKQQPARSDQLSARLSVIIREESPQVSLFYFKVR